MADKLKKLLSSDRAVAAIILLLVLNFLFFPVIWENKTLIHSARDASSIMHYGAYSKDTFQLPPSTLVSNNINLPRSNDMGAPAWFAEPYYAFISDCYFKLFVPALWNPFNGLGVPLLANMQSQPFNPLALIAWFNPSPRGDDLFVMARLFLAGLFMHFYLRRFVGPYSSLFGALSFMLTGYFVIYLNMPDISVSIWLPALFYVLELLALRLSRFAVLLVAPVTAIVLLSGMPEVSFLVLVFGAIYFAARLTVLHWKREQRLRGVLLYVFASICGVGIAAPQIVPFLEYMRESFNAHQVGSAHGTPGLLVHSNFDLNFAGYLMPLIFGPLGAANLANRVDFKGIQAYWGVVPFFFALLSVSTATIAVLKNSAEKKSYSTALVWFFLISAVVLVGKRFGFVLVNWIGTLPLAQMVLFCKYDEPLIGFSIAVLAAIGFDCLESKKMKRSALYAATGVAALTIAAVYLFDRHAVVGGGQLFRKLIWLALGLVSALAVLSRSASSDRASARRSLRLILFLLMAEMSLMFLLPTFYWLHQLASRVENPYVGAPYIDFLKSKVRGCERVLGFDGVLYPNWSSAFGLFDVRDLDAMYPRRYLPFIRSFVEPGNAGSSRHGQSGAPGSSGFSRHDQLADPPLGDNNITTRFTGAEPSADPLFTTASPQSLNKLWTLCSVRYLLANREHFLPPPSQLTRQILAANAHANADYLRLAVFNVAGQYKYVLFQHPYGPQTPNTVEIKTVVPPDRPRLNFSISMDCSVHGIAYGDGVDLKVTLVDGSSRKEVYAKYIDPKLKVEDRRWFPASVDLSEFKGRPVALELSVDCGHNGNVSGDWAGWADLQFEPTGTQSPPPKPTNRPNLVYDKEIKIYELPDALPRAALFYGAINAKSSEDALGMLHSTEFNVKRQVIVETGAANAPILTDSSKEAVAQRIDRYEPLLVDIEVKAEKPGLLMLNDQFYPGWNAYVDDKPAHIYCVDYLFRGVAVEPGSHRVVFKYEPASFLNGLLICLASLAAMILFALYPLLHRSMSSPPADVNDS